jgi:hypothetical protein
VVAKELFAALTAGVKSTTSKNAPARTTPLSSASASEGGAVCAGAHGCLLPNSFVDTSRVSNVAGETNTLEADANDDDDVDTASGDGYVCVVSLVSTDLGCSIGGIESADSAEPAASQLVVFVCRTCVVIVCVATSSGKIVVVVPQPVPMTAASVELLMDEARLRLASEKAGVCVVVATTTCHDSKCA